MTRPQTYSVQEKGQRRVWHVPRLWELSRELPVFEYRVADFDALDLDIWFCGVHAPTVRAVIAHHERIAHADLSVPIVLSEGGQVMDGVHRICRAISIGRAMIPAVRFEVDPPPDRIEHLAAEEG